MKFSFSETMCDPSHLIPLAIEADQAGYDSFGIPDSICYPEEVAAAVVFLASDEASFVNGNATYVDNGWYAKG